MGFRLAFSSKRDFSGFDWGLDGRARCAVGELPERLVGRDVVDYLRYRRCHRFRSRSCFIILLLLSSLFSDVRVSVSPHDCVVIHRYMADVAEAIHASRPRSLFDLLLPSSVVSLTP